MNVWNHTVKAVSAAVAIAGVFAVANYLGITVPATVAWLKSLGGFWGGDAALPRWALWLWAAISIGVATRLISRLLFALRVTPQQNYRGDVLYGLRWQWDVSANNEVLRPRMFCAKCYHEFRDADFRFATPTAAGPVWNLACETCANAITVPGAHELYRRVKAEAERKIRTGEWRQAKRSK